MSKNLNIKGLDELGHRILEELYLNARISTIEIGRRVGLSSPAVAERIQRMEESGYITGYHARVNFDMLGLTIRAFITIKPSSTRHHEMIKVISAMPEIVEWSTLTGNICIILKAVTSTTKQLENVIQQLQPFGETSTSLILSESNEKKLLRTLLESGGD